MFSNRLTAGSQTAEVYHRIRYQGASSGEPGWEQWQRQWNICGENTNTFSVVRFNRHVMFCIYHLFPAHPSKETSMVSESSTWIGRQSLTSSFVSGVNSSKPLTDRPGATNWNELDAVNLNNCMKKNRKSLLKDTKRTMFVITFNGGSFT